MDILNKVFSCCFIPVCIALGIYIIFVYLPIHVYTEAECLRNGYPKSKVSVGLERYCMTLDGAVTVKVKAAGDE